MKLNVQNMEKIPAVRENNIRFEVFVNPVQLTSNLAASVGAFDVDSSENLLSASPVLGDSAGGSLVGIAQS
jgi:hypothetical protein